MAIFIAGVVGLIFSAFVAGAERDLAGEVRVPPNISPTDLLVSIANFPSTIKPSQPLTVILDQRNQTFHPHVLAIVKGTTVKFVNSDRVAHNVFSFSSTKNFDLGRIVPNTFGQMTFEKPGLVEVLCGFHSRMLAYIHVMEHPYFAIPDAQGRFTIKDLPPGTYRLRVWHERLGEVSKEVKVTEDRSVPIQLILPR
jgi:plastocyanin